MTFALALRHRHQISRGTKSPRAAPSTLKRSSQRNRRRECRRHAAVSVQLSAKAFCREDAQEAQDGCHLLSLHSAKQVRLIAMAES